MDCDNSKGENCFTNCLRVALSVMKTKIIASTRASVGMIFFGCRPKADIAVQTLFSLSPPSAARLQELQDMIDDLDLFEEKIGFGGSDFEGKNSCLKEALWTCHSEFNVKARKQSVGDYKRIWIFTNDDNPYHGEQQRLEQAIQVSKDCAGLGMETSLWHMDPASGSKFDLSKFYTRLLSAEEDELALRVIGAGNEGFDAMLSISRRKEHKKRRLGTIRFHLSSRSGGISVDTGTTSSSSKDGLGELRVELYKLIAQAKKPDSLNLQSTTNFPLKTVSTLINSNGKKLHEEDLRLFLEVQGTRIYFTRSEFNDLKHLGFNEGILEILYFTDATAITSHPEFNYRSPYFVTPDEKKVKGTSSLFFAVVNSMIVNKVIGVATFMLNRSSLPRLVAIIPQTEVIDEDDGVQILPGGMNLVILPWISEMRSLKVPEMVAEARTMVNPDMVKAATKLTSKWQFEETSGLPLTGIENPSIQCFYGGLQAIALNQPQSEWQPGRDDQMVVKFIDESVQRDVSEAISQLKTEVRFDDTEEPDKKRTTSKGLSSSAKRMKMEKAEAGDFDSMTIDALKEVCRERGLKISGKKADLIERLREVA